MTESFGPWLKERRKALDLTQQALAHCVGCAVVTIKKIEAGQRRPSRQMAQRLAHCLQVDVAERAAFVRSARLGAPLPRPAPASAGRPVPSSLPAPMTGMVGREVEVAALVDLLLQEDVRLATLLGPPGVGKTCLALQAARQVEPLLRDGARWVDLTQATETAAVAHTIRLGLDLPEPSNGERAELARLQDALRGRELLLVLDNFEQVVMAGPVLVELLTAVAGLTILVTSRVPLHVYGEHQYPLRPLPLPDSSALPPPTELKRQPAVQLFERRARAVRPEFALSAENAAAVVAICRQVDGLPLGIELAAAHVRQAGIAELLSRLRDPLATLTGGPRDLPPRQQSLRRAIAWSYESLSPSQRHFFDALGVFSGGFTAAAAAAVGGGGDLVELCDSNLVQVTHLNDGEKRYNLLETLRAFVLEQLHRTDANTPVHHRHATYFGELAAAAWAMHHTAELPQWQARMRLEQNNVNAALAWCLDHDPGLGLALAANMWNLWYLWGQYRDGSRWLEQFLALNPAATVLRGRALRGSGVLRTRMGRFLEARPLFAESLAVYDAVGEERGKAKALMGLADVCFGLEDPGRARPYVQEALVIFKEVGDSLGISWALGGLATVTRTVDRNPDVAVTIMEECVNTARQAGDQRHLAWMLSISADLARDQNALAPAEESLLEALSLFAGINDLPGLSYANLRLGGLHLQKERREMARKELMAALELGRETFTMSYVAQAVCLLGVMALENGRFAAGVQLCASATALHDHLHNRLLAPDLVRLDAALAEAQQAPGGDYNGWWRRGKIMAPADVLTLLRLL